MESTIKKIDELVKEETNITIKAKILSISQKEANTQKGKTVYYYGLLGDTTGVMPFTAWSMPTTVRDKDVYQITKCYTKMFNERIRIYFDQGTEGKRGKNRKHSKGLYSVACDRKKMQMR